MFANGQNVHVSPRRFILWMFSLTVLLVPSAQAGDLQAPWRAYVGAAAGGEDSATVDSPAFDWLEAVEARGADLAPWAGSYRGLGRRESSLQQYLRGQGRGGGDPDVARLIKTVRKAADGRQVVLQLGGMPIGDNVDGVRAFSDFIARDRGTRWKDLVRERVKAVDQACPKPGCLLWQIGNEINKARFAEAVRALGQPAATGRADDPAIIPFYVERYLAPSVEAIRAVSQELYGRDSAIPVVAGSVAGFDRESSRRWLDALLAYVVRGDFSPTLAGKAVHELVDIASYHYLVTWSDEHWRTELDETYRKWLGKGRIRGLWATEELGIRLGKGGRGAGTALKVLARYLTAWSDAGVPPDSARIFFWGWRLGPAPTRGDVALRIWQDFLGNARLRHVPDVLDVRSAAAEHHAFITVPDERRMAVVVLARQPTGHGDKQNAMSLRLEGWKGSVRCTAHVFGHRSHERTVQELAMEKGQAKVTLPSGLRPEPGAAALLLLERL